MIGKILKLAFIFLAGIFFIHPLLAQTNTAKIVGQVLDAEGKPAANLSVNLVLAGKFTLTDAEGKFKLTRLYPSKDTLLFSSADLKPVQVAVTVSEAVVLDIGTIHIGYDVKKLQDVEIKGRAAKSYKSDYSFVATKTEARLKDIPQTVSTITKELIKDKMQFTRKEALTSAAGISQYSGYDEYTIRGFRAENASNINGLRGYNSTYTSSMLVNIESIEIIKGPAASLYGNGDPGGTINMVTKKPLDKFAGSVDIYGGSWNHFRGMTDITGPLNKSKTLLYRFNAGYDNSQSFRDLYFNKSYQLAPSLSFIPNDRVRINVDFSYAHVNSILDRGQPGFENDVSLQSTSNKLTVSQPGDDLKETNLALIVGASYQLNKKWTFNQGYLHYNTRQSVNNHGLKDYLAADSVSLYFTRWNYRTFTNTLSNYFTYQTQTGSLTHKLLFGHDYIRSKVNLDQQFYEQADLFGDGSGVVGSFSLRNPHYQKRPVDNYQPSGENNEDAAVDATVYATNGIYLQDFITYGRWRFIAGCRQEFYRAVSEDGEDDVKQNVLTWRAGAVYAVNAALSVYGSYNTGFDPFEATAGVQRFDQPIKPQQSSLIEAGVKSSWLSNKLNASLAVYRLTVKNIAVNANDVNNPDLYIQQGENQSVGTELEINGNLSPNLSAFFSYSYCRATITRSSNKDDIGKLAANAPLHAGSSWINYSLNKGKLKGLGCSFGHEFTGRRTTLQQEIVLPAYLIINSSIHYRYKNLSIAALINNIGNKRYWMAAYNNVSKWPGAPRNMMIRIGYQF